MHIGWAKPNVFVSIFISMTNFMKKLKSISILWPFINVSGQNAEPQYLKWAVLWTVFEVLHEDLDSDSKLPICMLHF